MGYVLRLTELNYYDTPSWILQLTRIKSFVQSNLSFNFNNELNLSRLAQLTRADESALAKLLYHPADSVRRKMGLYLVFGAPVFQYVIRPRTPKVCAGCLRDFGYIRKIWDLAPVTACPIHKCHLLDECQSCRKRIGWARPGISLCKCGSDWREHPVSIIDDSELSVVHQIYKLCRLETGSAPPTVSDLASPIYKLDLKSYISALFLIASQYAGIIDIKGKYFVVQRSNFELHEFLCKAQVVFYDWPNNYYSFLDWRKSQQDIQEPKQVWNWGRAYNKYKSSLFVRLAQPQFDFLRSAFHEYITIRRREQIIAALPVTEDIVKSEQENIENLFISGKEAKKVLGIDWKGLKGQIAAGNLQAVIQTKERNTSYLIDKLSVDDLKDQLNGALFLQDTAKTLGITEKRVKDLIKAKLLQPICGRTIDRARHWKFSKNSVEGLLSALNEKSRKIRAAQNGEFLTFEETIARLSRFGIGISVLIQAIINQEIRPNIKSRDKKVGLSCFMFSIAEVSNFIRDERHLRFGDVLTVSEASKVLEVSTGEVRLFIEKGLLQAETKPQIVLLGRLIRRKDLELFQSTYALGRKLASELQTTASYLAETLASCGIYQVAGERETRRSAYLFQKTDLEELDLLALIKEKKSNQRKSYYSAPLNIGQAAELLQIDRLAIIDLVERGILKVHCRPSNKKQTNDELHFSSYSIKCLIGKVHLFDGLVSTEVAAKLLGKSTSNLSQYYVQTGRLKIACTKDKRMHLFKKRDIEMLVKSKNEQSSKTVLSRDVAKILGVGTTTIKRLIESGLLKLFSGPTIDGSAVNRYLRRDVERLHADREAFKAHRLLQGMTSRFGRPPGRSNCPVQDVIGPRIEQLIKKWSCQSPDKKTSGTRLHRQLLKEGYKVAIDTVYKYLGNKRKREATAA